MHRIQSLFRHTAIYGIGDLLGRAVAVLLVPIYARHLTPEDNGIISLAFAVIGFSAVFYSLGLNPALVRLLSGKTDLAAHRTAFSSAFYALLLIGLTLSFLMWTQAHTFSQALFQTPEYRDIFRLIAAIVLLDALSEPLFSACRARQRSLYYAVVRLAQHTLQLGLTAYLIAGLDHGPIAVFHANIASSLFALCAIAPVALSLLRPAFNTDDLRNLLAFGLPFVPSALSILIINLSDRFLIRYFLGLDDLGVYSIAYKLGLPVFFIVKALHAAWAPAVLNGNNTDETRHLCARITTYFAVIGAFACLVLATYARELIGLIAGANAPAYLPGANVAILAALAFFFYGFYVLLTAGVYAEGRAGSLPAIVGAGAGINLIANLILLPRIGFVAAAWSTLMAYAVMAGLLFLSVRRFYPVPCEYARLGKVAVAATVVFLALSRYLHDATTEGIIARGIFLVGYPLILWGWHFFIPGEWQQLCARRNKTSNTQNP